MIPVLLLAASVAFGPHILDLALDVDDAAMLSLKREPQTDVPATLMFQESGVEREIEVLIHIKGQLGSARSIDDKPALKITCVAGRQLFGLEHLTLNNMVQDPTMLHESLGYQVYEAAGVPVPRTSYVRLAINGRDYGLYLNVETIDSVFLERRFGNSSGILYEGSYGADLHPEAYERLHLDKGSDPDRAQLSKLIDAVQAPDDRVFYGETSQVETKEFLAMMAAGALLDDWDNYYAANNYRLYWNPATTRWHFIPTGIDQTFGGDITTVYGASGVLFLKCLKSTRCGTEYSAMVREVADRFERLDLGTAIDARGSLIDGHAGSDPKRPYDEQTMRSARESMRRFIERQPTRVRAELPQLNGSK
jgi:spore coat protein CotH